MTISSELFQSAKRIIPGGVNSPVRAFKSVGLDPIFISSAKGSKMTDVDGNTYIDYVGSWGPMIVGHANDGVLESIFETARKGTSFGAPTLLETRLAELVVSSVPSIDMVRMVNSGTEATMSAIRLARGYTDRDLILKFEGCYHGHGDSLLVKAGSGVETLGLPDSPGVPADLAKNTITVPFNNLPEVEKAFKKHKGKIACVILEPIVGNMGVLPPKKDFLEGLRDLCSEHGTVLIFDEVMTGFRVALGGAQELYRVTPDLTTLGKIIGGGLPVGAYGGKREIMEKIAPAGPIYQAGTLSGNPLAMAAGIATLNILRIPGTYSMLETKAARLAKGLEKAASEAGVKVKQNRVGSMFSMFFTESDVFDYESAKTSDTAKYAKYFAGMLKEGVYLAPSQFEAGFISLAHTDEDISDTVSAAERVLKTLS
ncbi:MAG: glutamate-1-semialdehyde 2,1-aminomutase [Nitrospinota bacterium]|nr:glutamate-1-semialdehyde 2,1-aminomutase [Nitrospinota bacterium]